MHLFGHQLQSHYLFVRNLRTFQRIANHNLVTIVILIFTKEGAVSKFIQYCRVCSRSKLFTLDGGICANNSSNVCWLRPQ